VRQREQFELDPVTPGGGNDVGSEADAEAVRNNRGDHCGTHFNSDSANI
jgi:hypothetical protein